MTAIVACTRLLQAPDRRQMGSIRAYYNRGLAFAAIGELELAKADFGTTLSFNPTSNRYNEALEDVEVRLKERQDTRNDYLKKTNELRQGLALPKLATASHEPITREKLLAAWCGTRAALKSKEITREQALEQEKILAKWNEILIRENRAVNRRGIVDRLGLGSARNS